MNMKRNFKILAVLLLWTTLIAACDGSDDSQDPQIIPILVPGPVVDQTGVPVPGDSELTSTSTGINFTLSWEKATDNITAQSNLKYRVYYSTSNNISTISDVLINGTNLGTAETDISQKQVTTLPLGNYYFNVLVMDEDYLMSAYTMKNGVIPGWQQEAYIKAGNNGANDEFGYRVAISGDTIVLGTPSEDSNQTTITNGTGGPYGTDDGSHDSSGAAYVYRKNGSNQWSQEAFIKAGNNSSIDRFGSSVSISGDTMAVGAYTEDCFQTTITNGTGSSTNYSAAAIGAVYVYRRNGSNHWSQEAYIKASNGVPDSSFPPLFGTSISISDNTLVVGATGEYSNHTTITNGTGSNTDWGEFNSGAVYVYRRDGSNQWAQEAYIKAGNSKQDFKFGSSVSMSGDTIAVGAPGEACDQTTITNGTGGPYGTYDVANYANSGAVYVYRRNGSNEWAQEAYIKAGNNGKGDEFGSSVSISGDTILVGSINEDSNQTTITNGTGVSSDDSISNSGAVYVFKRDGSNQWSQEAYIKAGNNETNFNFGSTVFIMDDIIAIGSKNEDSDQSTITNGTGGPYGTIDGFHNSSGAVYVYRRNASNQWSQEAYIKAGNNNATDYFGSSISILNDTIVVGSYGEESNQATITNGTGSSTDNSSSDSGAVYVYKLLQ